MSDISDMVSRDLRSYSVDLSEFKIGDSIGAGAFGEVFLATHINTQKKRAIKKLYTKELKGQDLKLFVREAEILAVCKNKFLLPFFGCTLKYPFSIITEYIPCGTLFNAINHKEGSPDLSATNKSIIAYGIARGLQYLHEHNIIHRDIKSRNILLRDNLYPVICDFGLSRRVYEIEQPNPNSTMTRDVGTPHYMSPELIFNRPYTNKIDVYAYAIILWEMLKETTPYKGMSDIQIAYAVTQKDERPEFPKIIQPGLKSLISRCWDKDPDKRPTFKEIVREFKDGKVYYHGTEQDEFKNFMHHKDHPSRHLSTPHSSGGRRRSVPKITPPSTPHQRKSKSTISSKSSESTDWVLVLNPSDPEFINNYFKAIETINAITAKEFFTVIQEIIAVITDVNVQIRIILPMIRVISKDVNLLKSMIESGLYFSLPLKNKNIREGTLMVFVISMTFYPSIMNQDFLNLLRPYISENCDHIIRLLNLYFKPGDHLIYMKVVVDFILENYREFLRFSGLNYLRLLNYVFSSNETALANRFGEFSEIFLKTISIGTDEEVVAESYKFIINYFDSKIVIKPEIIEKHLLNEALVDLVAAYLIRKPQIDITEGIVYKLIQVFPKSKLAFYELLDLFCDSPDKIGSALLKHSRTWMPNTESTFDYRLGIIIMIVSTKNLRPKIAKSSSFCKLLSSILDHNTSEFIPTITNILIKMFDEPKLYIKLSETDFFKKYIQVVSAFKLPDLTKGMIGLFETISRKVFIEDFLLYVPNLFEMLKDESEYTFPALSALTVMSTNEKVKELLKTYDFKHVLHKLKQVSSYKNYVASLQQYLS
ncbi:TKL family protein kinase [Trichomonas vaginalis G3]|uniref:TKL family protein kinase n=1 Tax=Trichomonas vaginalis (strain ATCC PRA-98 / G3) TaxID=412133 RepID=A2FGZ7_TRIV3|nr:protein kinase protein [Trichomonas vaginalis G3]EAX95810.1 TKL family protein kinase [Trichomonas vaginalis G3]KAI5500544.1 protein kinase protein [Trichomonas vaginalis G3]|eukprot:XP_001308740.1 TKL family protein kinase [Trichomonas vaginalis G3]